MVKGDLKLKTKQNKIILVKNIIYIKRYRETNNGL